MSVTTATLDVSGATLTYDVHTPEPGVVMETSVPPLFLVGSPMGAEGFRTLAAHFPDRVLVTYDPRGVERSTGGGGAPPTPETHADDLVALAAQVSPGVPVDVFATSGGAVNTTAWLARQPGTVRIAVLHEPPIASILPDAAEMRAAMLAIADTYDAKGFGPAMARFIAVVSTEGELTAGWAEQNQPDPATFGLPADDDGARDEPLFRTMRTVPEFTPDVAALQASGARIIVALGEDSLRVMSGRSAGALAELLGQEPVVFPGGHVGFSGGEYGQPADKPVEFAATLRNVLENRAG